MLDEARYRLDLDRNELLSHLWCLAELRQRIAEDALENGSDPAMDHEFLDAARLSYKLWCALTPGTAKTVSDFMRYDTRIGPTPHSASRG